MKFLIDECLHASLIKVAARHGHEGHHVNYLGLSGTGDRELMPVIVSGDYTFVTNNARDFRKLYNKEELHAGLVIIIPQVAPDRQATLFETVLFEIAKGSSMVNEVIEIELDGDVAVLKVYALPPV